jgi:hypothetical protein
MATGRWEMLPSTAYICMVPGNRIHDKTGRYLQSDRADGKLPHSVCTVDSRVISLGKSDNGKENGDKIGLRHTYRFTLNPGPGDGYIKARSR